MLSLLNIPSDIRLWIDSFSSPQLEPLYGFSESRVFRIVTDASNVGIIKISRHQQEYRFYQQVAPRVLKTDEGIIPKVYKMKTNAGLFWIVMEFINYLPETAPWPIPNGLLDTLITVHSLPIHHVPRSSQFQRPELSPPQRMKALEALPTALQIPLHAKLNSILGDYNWSFPPTSFCHGDPHSSNWGNRSNGSYVLFDWARFTLATPAYDLARLLPWKHRHFDNIKTLATQYVALWNTRSEHLLSHPDSLMIDIIEAKIFHVMEYLYIAKEHLTHDPRHQSLLLEFQDWLEDMSPILSYSSCSPRWGSI